MIRWIVTVWSAYAHRAASYQTRVLLNVVYALVLGPAASIGRLFGSRLLDTAPRGSTWLERSTPDKTLAGLRRQF